MLEINHIAKYNVHFRLITTPNLSGIHFMYFQEPDGPLKGVVIAVAKKLSKQQSEYNNIAAALGADYRWTYDQSCTHFIFQVGMQFIT